MRYCLCIFFLYCGHLGFSQSLEDKIYTATEDFTRLKNNSTYKILIEKETFFEQKAKTKDEYLALVFLKNNKGYYLKEKGAFPEAILAYENAWKLYTEMALVTIADYDIIEFCLKPLGNLYTKTNNYTNAENTIKEYLSLAQRQKNNRQYIAGIINLAVLYQTLNRHKSVLKLTENTLSNKKLTTEQRKKLRNIGQQSNIVLNRLQKVSELRKENSPEHYQNAYTLSLKNNDPIKALSYFSIYEKLKLKSDLNRRELAKFYVEKADLYLKTANTIQLNKNMKVVKASIEKAVHTLLPAYQKGDFPDTDALYAENTFIDIFNIAAKIQANDEDALKYYDLTFYVSDLIQGQLTSQEAKMANLANDRKRSEHCLELLFRAYRKNPSDKILERALHYAEIGKAKVLTTNFMKRSLWAKHPKDSLLLMEKKLLKEQEELTHLLVNSTTKNDSLSKQLLTTGISLKQIQQLVAKKYPLPQNKNNLREINNRLKEYNASLMVFFYGTKNLYQFILSPEGKKFLRKQRTADNNKSISKFIHCFDNASVINNNVASFKKYASELYQFLDMDKATTTKNLIIIPDGKLNFVPFDALLEKLTKTNNFTKMPFVAKKQQLSYNASIQLFLQKRIPSKNKNVLGLAPVFENTQQPLVFSLSEVEHLKKRTGAKILLREEATKANFLEIAKNYNVLHLSTHAISSNYTPLTSIYFHDGPLLLNELYSLDMDPDLVVLSACETGVGTLYKGEGVLSIARGFSYAGAKNVLFSLWQVNDGATATLMDLFYRSYVKNRSAATANWKAKLDYLNSEKIPNTKKSPYYWSAFVFSGDLEVEPQISWSFFYGIGLLILLVVLLLWIIKRK